MKCHQKMWAQCNPCVCLWELVYSFSPTFVLVLQKDDKYFTLQLGARWKKVSKDRLKPIISTKVIVPQVPLTRGHPQWLLWIVLSALQLLLRLGSVLCFLHLALRLVLCPPLQVLRFIEKTFLEWPDNQLQLHLLVNLVDDAWGTSIAELKMTFVDWPSFIRQFIMWYCFQLQSFSLHMFHE